MKAYIDHNFSELITVGFHPEFAREQMNLLGLERWAWIEDNDALGHGHSRAIPDEWEEISLPQND